MLKTTLQAVAVSTLLVGAVTMRGFGAQRPADATSAQSEITAPDKLEYNRDIRPTLPNNCFKCHGLDEKTRKAGLTLDNREDASRPSQLGGIAIVPRDPSRSELIRRVFSADDSVVMPPPQSQKKLSATEKA